MPTITVEQALELATTHHQAGRLPEADAICRQILAQLPNHPDALHLRGVNALDSGRYDEALDLISQAITQSPADPVYHYNLGVAFQRLGRLEEGITCFARALALQPTLSAACINLSLSLNDLGRFDESITFCQRALRVVPGDPEVHSILAAAFWHKGLFEDAVLCLRRAIACRPDFPKAHCHLAILLLLLGSYEEGWKEYEWRWRYADFPSLRRDFPTPQWNGTTATGQTILVHLEQGFGDAIQFIRYLPLVRQWAGARRVIIECPAPLLRLFRQSGEWEAEFIKQGQDRTSLPSFDQHIPLLGLPLALRQFEPLRNAAPYLNADPEMRQLWRTRLGPAASKFRVGLAWEGNAAHKDDHRRSLASERLIPLLQTPGVTFYSLQLQPRSQRLVDAGLIDLTAHLTDFADTAAFMAELDLIISVDTATAHLAGALGRPVWTLLPFVPDWRWELERDDTPWYPTMRLFRQTTAGDWDPVLQRVAEALTAYAAGVPPTAAGQTAPGGA